MMENRSDICETYIQIIKNFDKETFFKKNYAERTKILKRKNLHKLLANEKKVDMHNKF